MSNGAREYRHDAYVVKVEQLRAAKRAAYTWKALARSLREHEERAVAKLSGKDARLAEAAVAIHALRTRLSAVEAERDAMAKAGLEGVSKLQDAEANLRRVEAERDRLRDALKELGKRGCLAPGWASVGTSTNPVPTQVSCRELHPVCYTEGKLDGECRWCFVCRVYAYLDGGVPPGLAPTSVAQSETT